MRVDLAGLVVKPQGLHVLAGIVSAGQNVADRLLVVGDSHRHLVELGVDRRPVGGHVGPKGIAGGLVSLGLDDDLATGTAEDEVPGADAFLQAIDDLAMEFRQVVGFPVPGQFAGLFGFVRVAGPVADHLLHGQVAGQVLIEARNTAAEEEKAVLLIGTEALAFQVVEALRGRR